MTNPYTPEKVAELVEKAEIRVEIGRNPDGSQVYIADDEARMKSLAAALTAVSAERDEAVADLNAETAAHADSLNLLSEVIADRDRLHKAITEARRLNDRAQRDPDIWEDMERILRAALDKEGNDDA